jgi:crossover junction endodeoxyribonuclease RuvC
MARILGIDPGLTKTGWGILQEEKGTVHMVACDRIVPPPRLPIPQRLSFLYEKLSEILFLYQPDSAVVEKTFVNKNPSSALTLGFARGIALMVPAQKGIAVFEYAATCVKKAVTGNGHATKQTVQTMVERLLSLRTVLSEDTADALAIALCHVYHIPFNQAHGSVGAATVSAQGTGPAEQTM